MRQSYTGCVITCGYVKGSGVSFVFYKKRVRGNAVK